MATRLPPRRPVHFERIQGSQRRGVEAQEKVKAVEIVNAHHGRFHLARALADFTTFLAPWATG